MYEDRIFENLQSEMLQDTSTGVDQQEGSLIATSIAKQAVRLEEAYAELAYVYENMLVDTMDREHLTESGAEAGLPINEGTQAVVRVSCNCELPEGMQITALDSEYNYMYSAFVESKEDESGALRYYYDFKADEEGIAPGSYRGDVDLLDPVDDFEDAEVIGTTTAGTDAEDTEVYRERRLKWFDTKPCAGNRAYYEQKLKETGLAGGVKIPRRKSGETQLNLYFITAGYSAPTDEQTAELQAIVDPTEYAGDGYGLAAIGHVVVVHGASAVTINISYTLTLKGDMQYADIKTLAEEACEAYLSGLRKTWEEESGIIVRRSGIENALLDVSGVIDITDVKLNGTAGNLSLGEYEIPVLGEVTNG